MEEKLKEIKYLIQHLKDTEEEAFKLNNDENNPYTLNDWDKGFYYGQSTMIAFLEEILYNPK